MAHIRQSRTDSGLGFPVKVPKTFQVVAFSLGSVETENATLRTERNVLKIAHDRRTHNLSIGQLGAQTIAVYS